MTALVFCTLAAPAEIYATPRPQSRLAEYSIEIVEPEHGHAEPDTDMLTYAFLDVHSPVVTGDEIQSQQSRELLRSASRGMEKWWARTVLGRRFVLGHLIRDERRRPANNLRSSRKSHHG